MSAARLSAEDHAAIADAVAARMVAYQSPVWTAREIALYTPYKSASAQGRFLRGAGIAPCAQGQFSRAAILRALTQLSKKRFVRRAGAKV